MQTRTLMRMGRSAGCVIAVTLACWCSAASAQAVVHALGGTLQDVSAAANSLTLTTDDGSSGAFELPSKPGPNFNLDKELQAGTSAPDTAKGDGSHVILYYVWQGEARIAVAVQSLGAGPFVVSGGKVMGFNKHDRVLTVRTVDGKTETVQVSDKTVVDSADGVATGARLHVGKGDEVRLLSDAKNGAEQALLIRTDAGD